MKTIAKAFGLIALGSLGSMAAQVIETEDLAEVQEDSDGSSNTETESKAVATDLSGQMLNRDA